MSAGLTRRSVLAACGGLIVSVACRAAEQGGTPPPAAPQLPGSLQQSPLLDAWIRVAPDGAITAFTGKAELGQGLKTALLQIVAEQLEVRAGQVRLVTADTALTPNEGFTAGSHSMQDSGTALLHAAAQVRALLQEAASARLGVPTEALRAADAMIHAPDGRSLSYGALADALSLHVAAAPQSPLVPPAAYRVMGTPMPRVDIPAKVTGGPAYVQDLRLAGMLHGRVIRQPRPGAELQDLDAGPVERMPGVVKVIRDGSFLAVVAAKEWQAVKAMRALAAASQWSDGEALPDPATILETIRALPARDIPILAWSNPAGAPVRRLAAATRAHTRCTARSAPPAPWRNSWTAR